ncbi:Hypothetical_protein [Hexamita inflata]|uniref:Hypothetical_protein n=1 Tax=Hexamita inflata TaxID=28002 RepID=A0ABP1GUR3_9EUKA
MIDMMKRLTQTSKVLESVAADFQVPRLRQIQIDLRSLILAKDYSCQFHLSTIKLIFMYKCLSYDLIFKNSNISIHLHGPLARLCSNDFVQSVQIENAKKIRRIVVMSTFNKYLLRIAIYLQLLHFPLHSPQIFTTSNICYFAVSLLLGI